MLIRTALTLVAFSLLIVPAAAEAAPKPERVERTLIRRGFDYAQAQCNKDPARPWPCRYQGRERGLSGALRDCRGQARVGKRAVRILKRRRCVLVAPAPPWPEIGFNMAWSFDNDDLVLSRQAGATTSRMLIDWAWIEPVRGLRDWSKIDPTIRRLELAETPPLLTILGAPKWARSPADHCANSLGCAFVPDRAHNEDWRSFNAALAARYPNVRGIEIYNEPNWNVFYAPAPDPERYAELVTLANAGVDSVAPQIPVLFAGLLPTTGSATAIGATEFLERAYRHGLSYDILGAHAYPHAEWDGPAAATAAQLDPLLAVAAAHGHEPQMWLTEIGFSSSMLGEEGQAEAFTEAYRWARRSRRIDMFMVHKLRDGADLDGTDWGYGLGLRREDDTPKPAFCALASLRGSVC